MFRQIYIYENLFQTPFFQVLPCEESPAQTAWGPSSAPWDPWDNALVPRRQMLTLKLPSGKHLHNELENSPFLMGKLTINGHFQ